jgi:hypothetical protein
VGKVGDVRTANAREKVLEPAGETGHLVREHRAADDDLVIVEQVLVSP